MDELSSVQTFIVWVIPVLFAITCHEVAHGWVAKKLGDPTAMMLGRLTLNPFKHIDPIGTVLVPAVLFISGGMIFGWAKPVPVTWENLKNPARDMSLVAIAGPLANLAMALLWLMVIKIAVMINVGSYVELMIYMGYAGVTINLVLLILNLLPIPPLDGSRIIHFMLPPRVAYQYSRLEPYGLIIMVVLLMTGVLEFLVFEPTHFLRQLLMTMIEIN